MCSQKLKYTGINLTKYVNNQDTENYKILMTKKKNPKKMKRPFSWVGRLNIVKMLILLKLIYRFKTNSSKISAGFLINKTILNCTQKDKN